MKLFPNGLSSRMSPLTLNGEGAAALVQRTLAQHGLTASMGIAPLQAPKQNQSETLPNGARFTGGSFACAAGTRDYFLDTPAATQTPKGLIVMLHGCTQTPQDFAAGTAMNVQAEQHGLAILYPAQARGANAQSCWNWFSKGDQRRDRGEPAILAGMTAQIIAQHSISQRQVFVAGLSAGGAMSVIMAETYPDVFAAVGVHSGLPFGAATDVASAFSAMAGQITHVGLRPSQSHRKPTIVFHGTADAVVNQSNGEKIIQDALPNTRPQVQTVETGLAGGRRFTRTITSTDGQLAAEHWAIEGMGHAWSGGQVAGSYTDAQGPDASAEMVRFFLQSGEAQPDRKDLTPSALG